MITPDELDMPHCKIILHTGLYSYLAAEILDIMLNQLYTLDDINGTKLSASQDIYGEVVLHYMIDLMNLDQETAKAKVIALLDNALKCHEANGCNALLVCSTSNLMSAPRLYMEHKHRVSTSDVQALLDFFKNGSPVPTHLAGVPMNPVEVEVVSNISQEMCSIVQFRKSKTNDIAVVLSEIDRKYAMHDAFDTHAKFGLARNDFITRRLSADDQMKVMDLVRMRNEVILRHEDFPARSN